MNSNKTKAVDKIFSSLPPELLEHFSKINTATFSRISEIRLHSGGVCSLTIDGTNYFLSNAGITSDCDHSITITKEHLDMFISRFCNSSVFAHEDTLKEFFIVSEGIRAGLAGEAILKDGKISTIGEIYSINIRLPCHIDGCSKSLYNILSSETNHNMGALIISPPGIGKTTFLRDLALKLSKGYNGGTELHSRRVCVIDERHEIYMQDVFYKSPCDFLLGVPKIKGIEIAVRLLSPEFIICDEIGTYEEAEKILSQTSSGIGFICSIHGKSMDDILKKKHIKKLFEAGVFSMAAVLSRKGKSIHSEICLYDNV